MHIDHFLSVSIFFLFCFDTNEAITLVPKNPILTTKPITQNWSMEHYTTNAFPQTAKIPHAQHQDPTHHHNTPKKALPKKKIATDEEWNESVQTMSIFTRQVDSTQKEQSMEQYPKFCIPTYQNTQNIHTENMF
jgi:hypothetical protein